MNKQVLYAIVFLAAFVTLPYAKVLLLVSSDYISYDRPSGGRFDRFVSDLNQQGITTQEEYAYFDENQFAIWYKIRDLYAAAKGTGDTIEGAVLIGNVAPTVFWSTYEVIEYAACDYFYMDVWKEDATPPSPYSSWGDVWQTRPGDTCVLLRSSYSLGEGDNTLDLWVSRIYATNLNYLRAAGAPWGTFLEEYEIIDAYFDRLHARMTGTGQQPPRYGFQMGPPPGSPFGDLGTHMALNNLGLTNTQTFNQSNLRLNQAAAWQAQLQRGRKGNYNWGAYRGTKFTVSGYQRNCQTNYSDVTGYEWAALYAHSTPDHNALHMYGDTYGCYPTGGFFLNINNAPAWTKKTSGGYSGSYYEWNIENNPFVQAEWSCVIPAGKNGTYEVYMYWKNLQDGLNSPNSEFSLHAGKSFSFIGCGAVNQTSSTGWHRLESTWPATMIWTQFSCSVGDTLVLRFHPNGLGFTHSYRCVADAVKFKKVTGTAYEKIIKTTDTFSIISRGSNGFRLLNWYNRSFYDMQDDGGQSKTPFFEILGCRPGNYLYDDCIGLLYAMGHAGLTSLVNTVPTNTGVYFSSYTSTLGGGNNFGSSYRAFAQTYYPGVAENFMLFGAGPLLMQSY